MLNECWGVITRILPMLLVRMICCALYEMEEATGQYGMKAAQTSSMDRM